MFHFNLLLMRTDNFNKKCAQKGQQKVAGRLSGLEVNKCEIIISGYF